MYGQGISFFGELAQYKNQQELKRAIMTSNRLAARISITEHFRTNM